MPTTRATRWRQRDSAIARKGAIEVAPWDEIDENVSLQMSKQPLKASQPLKPALKQPNSPVSVASTLDAETKPLDAEIKPLILPGAWIVVGKRGKPDFQNSKMYDEPAKMATKKKTKKKKAKNAVEAEAEPLVVLEEEASSSNCLRALDRSTAQRDKMVTHAKEAKFWADYQRAKQLKREALHELIAALAVGDDQVEAAAPAPSAKKPTKDHKANSNKDKARRRARSAAAAARCSLHDEDEGAPVAAAFTAKEAPPRESELSDELALLVGSSAGKDTLPTPVSLPGAWRTIGKRGKVLSDFPPLAPSDKGPTPEKPSNKDRPKKRTSSPKLKGCDPNEESPHKSVKREKALQCSVM